ncbi:MAG TPA: low affinity iron permease family protein [Nevskiaceae bacterium]|nr:low affinity iron permease family protein [Nevskiaceae bacterium]
MTQPEVTQIQRSPQQLSWFERFATGCTKVAGSSGAFATASLLVLVWALTGPYFHFSELWQIVINTLTTIITFLMVFVIQHSQNKDSAAIHLKLNELLAAHEHASNRVVAVEDLSQEELDVLRNYYSRLADLAAKAGGGLKGTHSLDDAEKLHARKHSRAKQEGVV